LALGKIQVKHPKTGSRALFLNPKTMMPGFAPRLTLVAKTYISLIGLPFLVFLVACGGGGSGGSSTSSGTTSSSSSSPPPTTTPSGGTVTVTAGQQTTEVNVEVGSITPSLSITAVGIGSTAGSVGAAVKQGAMVSLLVVGQGIVQGTSFSVSEASPADITVTQPSAAEFCKTTDGTPCVNFSVNVSASAAPGPRNVMVTNSKGELAAFVGGIIVTQ
jgi:hypothetical protein